MQKLRRCREDRWDFTAKDGNVFPIRIHDGGGLYGFCPAKAGRDHTTASLFELLVVCAETKQLLSAGGIVDQPWWFINLASWFLPTYDLHKFTNRVRMVMGDGSKSPRQNSTSGQGRRVR